VANRLPSFTGDQITTMAKESYRVLRPGGNVSIEFSNLNASGMVSLFSSVGFKNVRAVGNRIMGIK
jgi:ubiquinone/menaquinone biosynthesis C-methylase UbiE